MHLSSGSFGKEPKNFRRYSTSTKIRLGVDVQIRLLKCIVPSSQPDIDQQEGKGIIAKRLEISPRPDLPPTITSKVKAFRGRYIVPIDIMASRRENWGSANVVNSNFI